MKTLRFWTHNKDGWVRLSLKPGQRLTHVTGGRTDEGWSRRVNTWEHAGEGVKLSYLDEGRDCDGYVSQAGELFCKAEKLMSDVFVRDDGRAIHRPEWEELSEPMCRDEYAEASNY